MHADADHINRGCGGISLHAVVTRYFDVEVTAATVVVHGNDW